VKSFAEAILEVLWGQGWMLARDIAERLRSRGWEASSVKVGTTIRARLTHLVERHIIYEGSGGNWYMYRLIDREAAL
jgi:predicted transcriptional regulator